MPLSLLVTIVASRISVGYVVLGLVFRTVVIVTVRIGSSVVVVVRAIVTLLCLYLHFMS